MQIWLNYVDQILIYCGFALSLNLLLGYAGQVSVAHAAFGAIGGYTMGYLTLGRMFDNNIHDIIDDQIDTVTRGMLGLTVTCARCHDHKYDPVPQADYYSLYGVFAASETPTAPILKPRDASSQHRRRSCRRDIQSAMVGHVVLEDRTRH